MSTWREGDAVETHFYIDETAGDSSIAVWGYPCLIGEGETAIELSPTVSLSSCRPSISLSKDGDPRKLIECARE